MLEISLQPYVVSCSIAMCNFFLVIGTSDRNEVGWYLLTSRWPVVTF